MAKKKYYAVRNGREIGIFENWNECEASIKGYTNAEYKSFGTLEDANAYLNHEDIGDKHKQSAQDFQTVIAYVDGSYSDTEKKYSFGCIIITPEGELIKEYAFGDDPNALTIRNVAGELQGTMFAVKWAFDNKYNKILIKHDYIGISKWFSGEWKANNAIGLKYVDFMRKYAERIDITFEKVDAHTGDKFNEEADRLAKHALQHGDNVKSKIASGESWLTAEGIEINELEIILDILTSEVGGLHVENKSAAYAKVYEIISDKKEKLVIKYYEDKKKIHVQGKPLTIFSLFATYVTELVDVEKIPNIFNEYCKLNIKKDNVEEQYQYYCPNSIGKMPLKIERVLHQAVYNLNIDGNMYDMTFLAFPAFRALEGHLKNILGKHEIQYDDGFGMFKRVNNSTYNIDDKYHGVIGTPQKIAYFNKCYNYFHNLRHTYFHWNNPCAVIDTTPLVSVKEQAYKYIKDTLALIDEYYAFS